jgi:hypothetical protein
VYKYRTYIEALNHANKVKEKIYAERDEESLRKEADEKLQHDGEHEKQAAIDPGADLEKAEGSPELIEPTSS